MRAVVRPYASDRLALDPVDGSAAPLIAFGSRADLKPPLPYPGAVACVP